MIHAQSGCPGGRLLSPSLLARGSRRTLTACLGPLPLSFPSSPWFVSIKFPHRTGGSRALFWEKPHDRFRFSLCCLCLFLLLSGGEKWGRGSFFPRRTERPAATVIDQKHGVKYCSRCRISMKIPRGRPFAPYFGDSVVVDVVHLICSPH